MLKKTLLGLIVLLLLSNGIGALYGGWLLMSAPDGSAIRFDPELLRHSPFRDFFIPGLVLFVANGIGSLLTLGLLSIRHDQAFGWVQMQGVVLLGWILIQMVLIRQVQGLHFIFGAMGLILIWAGARLRRIQAGPDTV